MTAPTYSPPGTDARIDRVHPLRVERVVELGEPDDRHAVVLHAEDVPPSDDAAANSAFRERRSAALSPDDPRHGRLSTYLNYACRCDACRATSAAHGRAAYLRRKGGVA